MSRTSLLLPVLHNLTSNGDLIILDEPFTFLSEAEKRELTQIIHKAKEVRKSIVIATHNIEWIEENADTLELFTKEGRIWKKGSISFI